MKRSVCRYLAVIAAVSATLLAGCGGGDDNTEETASTYARFAKNEITVGSATKEEAVTVEWSMCNWRISTLPYGFISGFSTTSGGNKTTRDASTSITIYMEENPTSKQRSQEVTVKDMISGKQHKLTVVQEAGSTLSFKVSVNTDKVYQKVVGFGGMLNPSIWLGPNDRVTESEIDKMYGPGGLGYNILRLMVYDDKDRWGDDVSLAKKAQSYGAVILASPWYPPVNMVKYRKSFWNDETKYLPKENYAAYAAHLKSYVDYMTAHGVRIDVLSVQNEPDMDFCNWTEDEIYSFVKTYGREFGDVRVMAAESFCFRHSYTDQLLNDAGAADKFDIVGGHLYGGGMLDYPLAREKGKEVWMTEHLINDDSGNMLQGLNGLDWESTMTFVAKEIHQSMEVNFNTYIWWYLKRYYGMIGDTDPRSPAGTGEISKRGYLLSHYAKYATGKERVAAEYDAKTIDATAYIGDGEITVVLTNYHKFSSADIEISVPSGIRSATAERTSGTEDMADLDVTLGNDKKTATVRVDPQSVTSVRFKI